MQKKLPAQPTTKLTMSNQLMEKKGLTLAEQESIKSQEGGVTMRRKSRRYGACQKIKTKTTRLKRIQDLFWRDDTFYSSKRDGDIQGSHEEKVLEDARIPIEKNKLSKKEKSRTISPQLNDNAISNGNDDSKDAALSVEYKFGGRLRLKRIHDSPHVYTIDNFLTDMELSKLREKIRIADKEKMFNKSIVDGGDSSGKKRKRKRKESAEEVNPENDANVQRTSTFVQFGKLSNSLIAAIERKAADLLCMPNHSIEPLQLVRYSRGQFFHDHHDMGMLFEDGSVELPNKTAMTPPRRLVTILVYLNDMPNDDCGGSTHFPLLNRHENDSDIGREGLSIRPKKNMAVVWCNIKKDGTPDERLVHRGETLHGDDTVVKYAMNIWACEE